MYKTTCARCAGIFRHEQLSVPCPRCGPYLVALRPGYYPDTRKSSEAGETWRYLTNVPHDGDSSLERHTVAYMYRWTGSTDGWRGSISAPGPNKGLLLPTSDMPSPCSRVEMQKRIDQLLKESGYIVANDPNRCATPPRERGTNA